MHSISDGTASVSGFHILERGHHRTSRNIIHDLLATTQVDATLRPASPRKGSMRLRFDTYAAAMECDQLHAAGVMLTFTDEDIPAASMTYVLAGDLEVTLDPKTMTRGLVTIPFQEVTP